MTIRRLVLALILLLAPAMLAGCAEVPKSPEQLAEYNAAHDPLEPMNRVVFDVNDFLDRLLIRPLAELYRFAIPDYMRERVANILSNLGEPIVFANNMLQGELGRAGTTAERFGVNSVVGVGGIFEVADGWDLHKQLGDFGQTLSVWGIKEGPYLVLPLLGPSNFRDAIGLGVDSVASPWQYAAYAGGGTTAQDTCNITSYAADGLTRREQSIEGLDALRAGSLDFYAQMRSVTRQYRNKQLGIEDKSSLPDYENY